MSQITLVSESGPMGPDFWRGGFDSSSLYNIQVNLSGNPQEHGSLPDREIAITRGIKRHEKDAEEISIGNRRVAVENNYTSIFVQTVRNDPGVDDLGRPDGYLINIYRAKKSGTDFATFIPIYDYGICVSDSDCIRVCSALKIFFAENADLGITIPNVIGNADEELGHHKILVLGRSN